MAFCSSSAILRSDSGSPGSEAARSSRGASTTGTGVGVAAGSGFSLSAGVRGRGVGRVATRGAEDRRCVGHGRRHQRLIFERREHSRRRRRRRQRRPVGHRLGTGLGTAAGQRTRPATPTAQRPSAQRRFMIDERWPDFMRMIKSRLRAAAGRGTSSRALGLTVPRLRRRASE